VCVCVCVYSGGLAARVHELVKGLESRPPVLHVCVCVCVYSGGLASRVHELVKGLESRPPVLQKEIEEAQKSGKLPVFKTGLNLEFENVSGAYVLLVYEAFSYSYMRP